MPCSTTTVRGLFPRSRVPHSLTPIRSVPSFAEMRDSMKSKRSNRAEGDEEEEEEEEEGKGPAVTTTAADSSALAMVRMESLCSGRLIKSVRRMNVDVVGQRACHFRTQMEASQCRSGILPKVTM